MQLELPVGTFEGYYKDAPVTRVNGSEAINLVHGTTVADKNHFVLMYHPKCPACQQMSPEFKKFAQQIKDKKADVELDVINISKTDSKQMGAPHYPFMIFIKKGEKRSQEHGPKVINLKKRTAEEFEAYL